MVIVRVSDVREGVGDFRSNTMLGIWFRVCEECAAQVLTDGMVKVVREVQRNEKMEFLFGLSYS